MTWSDVYLFCFGFGFLFSLVAVLMGHFHFDWGSGADGAGADGGIMDAGGGHDAVVAADHGHDPGAGAHRGSEPSYFNMATISAFLAWFGGTGYLLSTFYGIWFVLTLLLSAAVGLLGAFIVFWFLTRVLMREREHLDPADYEMIGVLGTVSGAIRPGGVGEILFSQAGSRRAALARSDTGSQIASGTEVIVTRYEGGIAYVRRWDELTASAATDA